MSKQRLRPSLLPGYAPYLNFVGPGEEYEEGKDIAQEFTVARGTGPVIMRCLNKFGFNIIEWTSRNLSSVRGPVWDRLLMTNRDIKMDYTQADSGTKISSFPGTNSICRKDLLGRNYKICRQKLGEKSFNFLPEGFIIPEDWNLLREKMSEIKTAWIVKPSDGFAGEGIRIISDLNQVTDTRSKCTVQKYVTNPFLIKGLKFDIRLYVLLTSIDPLSIYLYNDGLVRFATEQFSMDEEDLGNKFIHITNPIVNKDNKEFIVCDDSDQFKGHKWYLKTLWNFLDEEGYDSSSIKNSVESLVLKTILCGRNEMIRASKDVKSDYSCFKLFGFDVLLDENLKPWLMEVNSFPGFVDEPLDNAVNEPMITEMFNIVGFHLTEPLDQDTKNMVERILFEHFVEFDSGIHNQNTTMEKEKTVKENKLSTSELIKEENLTPRKVRILIRYEEEISQAVNFSRINFSKVFDKLDLTCMSCETESDRLVEAWDMAYGQNRMEGRELLAIMCI